MDSESLNRYHAEEARERLFAFVGEILCRRCLCGFCRERMDAALKVAGNGPEAFLTAIRDHEGMMCGCAWAMKERAADAIGWSNEKTHATDSAGK
jgi:hypothetical protein